MQYNGCYAPLRNKAYSIPNTKNPHTDSITEPMRGFTHQTSAIIHQPSIRTDSYAYTVHSKQAVP